MAIGVVQGLIVTRLQIASFIVTLGGLIGWAGALLLISNGFTIEVPRSSTFQLFTAKLPEGFLLSFVWFIVIAVVAHVVLQHTRYGNWIFASGGGAGAARAEGVPVTRVKVALFGLTAGLASLAGVIQMSRFSVVDPQAGSGLELQVIVTAVMGGTLLKGGSGSVIGTVCGVAIIVMIQSGLILAGVSGYWFDVFVAVLLVGSVIVNGFVQRKGV
jgi:simple sugar transport system permease protein